MYKKHRGKPEGETDSSHLDSVRDSEKKWFLCWLLHGVNRSLLGRQEGLGFQAEGRAHTEAVREVGNGILEEGKEVCGGRRKGHMVRKNGKRWGRHR